MAKLQPKKIILDEINNGNEFVNKQKVDAKVINSTIEASAYAQALATNQPNIDDIDKEGTPSVEIEETENGTPRFKFSSLLQTNEGGGGGTTVTVGGVTQATWNADTKLDKVTTSGARRVYAINRNGSQYMAYLTENASEVLAGWIPTYRSKNDNIPELTAENVGVLVTGTPTRPNDCVTKKYTDDGLSGKLDIFNQASGSYRLYGVDNNGNQTMRYVVQRQGNVAAGWIACYRSASEIYDHDNLDNQTTSTLIVPTPTKLWACANKKYVDDNSGKLYLHEIDLYTSGMEVDGISFVALSTSDIACASAEDFNVVFGRYTYPLRAIYTVGEVHRVYVGARVDITDSTVTLNGWEIQNENGTILFNFNDPSMAVGAAFSVYDIVTEV